MFLLHGRLTRASLPTPILAGRSFRVAAPKRAVARASGVSVRAKLEAGDKVKVRDPRLELSRPVIIARRQTSHECQNPSRAARPEPSLAFPPTPKNSLPPPRVDAQVVSKVLVYHVPKGDRKNGTDLSGWEGVVDSRADDYNGTYISANLEVKVAFAVPNDPKGKTFIVHCKENELEKQ